jgi:cytochrome c-type biogenesis protein CcmH
MSAGDRQQMIRGMVDGLAARLDGEPGDVEGWLRLIRAYKVLGDDARASEAAGKASAANPAARPRIAETAQQLGIKVASAPAATAPPPPAPVAPLDAAAIRAGAAGPDVAGYRRCLDGNPNDREALWQVGLAEAATGNRIGAAELWGRLLGQFDPASPEYAALRERLDALKRGGQ